jgi:UDP-GlcNAc:undecaprenyl-phosphate GlcNAc-1-phosphate transferase
LGLVLAEEAGEAVANIGLFFSISFGLSLVLTELVKRWARRAGLVAHPRDDRWHREPVPLLGGVGICLSFFIPFLLAPGISRGLWILALVSLLGFTLGLLDDLRSLKPQTKLIGQILLASTLIYLDFVLRLTPYPFFNIVLTFIWIVGITNAFNLLDNMDGLCAGVAVIAVGTRLVFFLIDQQFQGAMVSAIFMGSMLGFLFHNFNPASIFMGDSGSLFIGFFLSGLNLAEGFPYTKSFSAILLFPVLILLVPIFDTCFVTLTRILTGRPVSAGGADHTSHRLVAIGLSERQAVVTLYLISLASGFTAFLTYHYGLRVATLLFALAIITLTLFGVYLSGVRTSGAERQREEMGKFFYRIADLPYKRQVASVLLDFILIIMAYYGAHLLRFEGQVLTIFLSVFAESLPLVIISQLGSLALCGMYRSVWRYMGISDLIRMLQSVTLGVVVTVFLVALVYRFEGFSRSVFILDWLLLLAFLGGSRLSFRLFKEVLRGQPKDSHPVLIYGAGEGGQLVVRELLNNPELQKVPVGFIDDDIGKRGALIRGYPVLGGIDKLGEIVREYRVSEIIVSTPKIDNNGLKRLSADCMELGVSITRATLTFHNHSSE